MPKHTRVGFLLLQDFSLMSYASAVEPMRAANYLSNEELYRWSHIALKGRTIAASSGAMIPADYAIGDPIDLDLLLVCSGGNPPQFRSAATFKWLRQMSRRGVRMGGLSGGSYVLARAGLLKGYRCTIHWEHLAALSEEFPDLQVTRSLFEIDRDRLSCSGGISALDMMHAVIEADHGDLLAGKVSDWFLHGTVRLSHDPQRMQLRERYGVSHPKLLQVLQQMENHVEEPVPRSQLATRAGLSIRQLERLFANHLGATLAEHYMRLRLERAQVLLRRSSLSILSVAVRTGFATASHFSRAYKRRFARTPRSERASWREPIA